MGIGLVVVKAEVNGLDWTNTWGLSLNGTADALVAGEIESLLAGTTPADETASHAASTGNFQGDVSPLYSILAFHRSALIGPARITGVYITDGKRNNQVNPSNVYASYAVNLPTLHDPAESDNGGVVPLSIAWLINRNVSGFGHKPGRLYLRHALPDSAVRPGTRDGVDWQSPEVAAAYDAALQAYIVQSGIGAWFSPPTSPPASGAVEGFIGLPSYAGEFATGQAGNLIAVTPLSGLSSHNPVSRQMTRGRRRRTTST